VYSTTISELGKGKTHTALFSVNAEMKMNIQVFLYMMVFISLSLYPCLHMACVIQPTKIYYMSILYEEKQ
jgi:hypothetical protein